MKILGVCPQECFNVLLRVFGYLLEFINGENNRRSDVIQQVKDAFQRGLLLYRRDKVQMDQGSPGQRIEGKVRTYGFDKVGETSSNTGFPRIFRQYGRGKVFDQVIERSCRVDVGV